MNSHFTELSWVSRLMHNNEGCILYGAYIQGVTKKYGTNFRTHSSQLEDEIMLYEHGSGNALFSC